MAASAGRFGTSSSPSEEATDSTAADTCLSSGEESTASEGTEFTRIRSLLEGMQQQQQDLLRKANDCMATGKPIAEAEKCLKRYTYNMMEDLIVEEMLICPLEAEMQKKREQEARQQAHRRERLLRMKARHQLRMRQASSVALSTKGMSRRRTEAARAKQKPTVSNKRRARSSR